MTVIVELRYTVSIIIILQSCTKILYLPVSSKRELLAVIIVSTQTFTKHLITLTMLQKLISQRLLQPLLACEDFELFKTIMYQRNVDLEVQALQLLQKQMGQPPLPYRPDIEGYTTPKDLRTARKEKEERMLQEALEQSKREYDQELEKEDQEMERLMKLAKQESLRMFRAVSMEKSEDDQEMERLVKMTEEESLKIFRKEGDKTEGMTETEEERSEGKKAAMREDEVGQKKEAQAVLSPVVQTSALGVPRDISLPVVGDQKKDQQSPVQASALGVPKDISLPVTGDHQKQDQPNLAPPSERTEAEPQTTDGGMSGAEAAQLWLQNAKSESTVASSSNSSIIVSIDLHFRFRCL